MRALRRTWAACGVVAALAVLMPASASAEPDPGFEEFANCPQVENIFACVHAEVRGGRLQLGTMEATIDEPISTVAALVLGADGLEVVPAEGGGPPPTPIKVPGGLLGIPQLDPLLDPLLSPLGLDLKAVPGLGSPSVGLGNELELDVPLTIKLENLLFGNRCYIGSPEEPIQLALAGTPDEAELEQDGDIIRISALLSDTELAVPGAGACDLLLPALGASSGLFDGVINNRVGLPSPSGANEAELDFRLSLGNPERIHK